MGRNRISIFKITSALVLIVLLAGTLSEVSAQNHPSIIEVGEFRYGLPKALIENTDALVELQTIEAEDGTVRKFYLLDEETETYVGFTYPPFRNEYVHGVQVTGYDENEELFGGIKLGMPKHEVFENIGPATDSSFVEVTGGTFYRFEGKNYSIEVDSEDRLYSVALQGIDSYLIEQGWPRNWFRYQINTIENVTSTYMTDVSETDPTIFANTDPFRPRVEFTGAIREVPDRRKEIIDIWLTQMGQTEQVKKLFQNEFEVRENGENYWVAIQNSLIQPLLKETERGKYPTDLFLNMIGELDGEPVFVCNEFVVL
ncbi:hypothetical protein [Rhodohalobacter sp.]|uniref:hypothetical protein n=1 Tax=Rhodohalobacter sp. TaxID=1974210 RepID=UPI002ACE91E1|nr:hypothetical protein [Rhodohalobacter sp.]MDZ7758316.1 hypothetical protein [Rhodohalobacter sp.]